MPISAPIIAALISAATAATTTGLSLAGAGQPARPPQPKPQPTGPTASQVQAAVTPQAMTIESLTGGSVSPEYLSTIAPVQAGVGGQTNTQAGVQAALQQILGNKGPFLPGTAPSSSFQPTGLPVNLAALASTPGTSDYLQKIAGGLG